MTNDSVPPNRAPDPAAALPAELALLRRRLMQAEKMASLGQLLAGVAHDINTPLGALRSNNDLFVRSLKKLREQIEAAGVTDTAVVGELGKLLDTMTRLSDINEEAADRIVRMVNSLRRFARMKDDPAEEGDINQWLDTTLVLVEHEFKNRIELVREYGVLPKVTCVAGRLNQVFMNLLVNAGHAIAGEGRVTVRTAVRGNSIVIEIEDTGHGIPAEIRERIFEPGFTTKEEGVGTGLGLSIARQIMTELHGSIEVESRVSHGTLFRLVLPIEPQAVGGQSRTDEK